MTEITEKMVDAGRFALRRYGYEDGPTDTVKSIFRSMLNVHRSQQRRKKNDQETN